MKKTISLAVIVIAVFSFFAGQAKISPLAHPTNDPALTPSSNGQSFQSEPQVKNIVLPNKVRLEYVEQGQADGIPVIFLHGLTDSWHSYEYVLPHLPANIHAYVLSQRGHGNSDRPLNGYLPYDFSSDLAAFMDTLNIKDAVIVGHSLGGTIAQRFALDHPSKLRALVLAGSFSSYRNRPDMLVFRNLVAELRDPIDPQFAAGFQQSTIGTPIPQAYLDTLVNESLKVPARVWQNVIDGLMEVDYTRDLLAVKKPTLIIWGDLDAFAPLQDQERLQNAIKGSKLLVYKKTGHAVHWEQHKKFAEDLLQFIAKLPRQ
ncbi:MAG TPA: alpha/beta hydrolase [Flavisolibacter sp.]|nr:alpha/beta hydrolase [Flavisolibacter sp.]